MVGVLAHILPYIRSKQIINSLQIFVCDGWIINFPCEQDVHKNTLDWIISWRFNWWHRNFQWFFTSLYYKPKMAQPVMPNHQFVLICKLLVYSYKIERKKKHVVFSIQWFIQTHVLKYKDIQYFLSFLFQDGIHLPGYPWNLITFYKTLRNISHFQYIIVFLHIMIY